MNKAAENSRADWGAVAIMAIVAAYIGLEFSVLHTQRYRAEPLFIHNEFVTAHQATLRCGEPNPDVWQRFQTNFSAIRSRALQQLKENQPQSEAQELVDQLAMLADRRRSEVDAFIDTNGCKHKDVWRWVKLHEVRARLNIHE